MPLGNPPGRRLVAVLVSGFVLFLTLGVTWFAWQRVGSADARDRRAEFEFRAREAEARIVQRMEAYEQALVGAAGLFAVTERVGRAVFREYVTSLGLQQHYPAALGLGFAQVIPASDLGRHIETVRAEGFPDYAVHPVQGFPGGSARPEGRRGLFTSIVFVEPFSGRNLREFGYDMLSEPVRRAAMEKARDEARPTLSGKVTLLQETDKNIQPGVLLYLPVFRSGPTPRNASERRESLVGWVYMPLRMGDLMRETLGERADELDILIYDGTNLAEAGVLFSLAGTLGPPASMQDALEARRTFKLAGRPWTLVLRARPAFGAGATNRGKALLFGITVSLLLTALVWVLVERVPRRAAGAVPARPPAPSPVRSRRILLAEDNPVNQLLATRLLQQAGHSVTVASDGRRALELLEKEPFDLVLMDVQMPEMDGLEAMRRLRFREEATGAHMHVVAVTAQAMSGDKEQCLVAGADDYLAKPYVPAGLEAAIAAAVVPSDAQSVLPEAVDLRARFKPCRDCTALDHEACENRMARSPLDLQKALATCGGDEALRREATRAQLRTIASERAELRAASASGDRASVARVAHKLRSSLGALGATPCAEAGNDLEEAARGNDPLTGQFAIRFFCELDRAVPALEASLLDRSA